jgi:3-dehydroquinate synthase
MRRLRVSSQAFSYDVLVGCGAWRALRQFPLERYSSLFILTDRRLWGRWGKSFLREGRLRKARPVFVPCGETSKSLRRVEEIAGQLLQYGADRQSLLLAFGGGVVGDLGGFVASTYMRGIGCVQVPTTLVAQVDSAIGGKTAVNIRAMKNLIGTFYPPRLVLAEPRVLASLGTRAFRSGLYEIVKHAILAGPGFFRQLEAKLDTLHASNAPALEPVLARAAQVKADVVSRDEREAGLRRILNLGHTFGHALEEATDYRRFMHGEAVGWGLLAVTRLAELLGVLKAAESGCITRLVRRVGPLPSIRHLPVEKVLKLLPRDKKAIGGQIHWVLPERIGKVRIEKDVPLAAAAAAFRDLQRGHWDE